MVPGCTYSPGETYRIGAHSSSDDPTRYRDEREVDQWKKRDPLELMRSRLQAWGLWTARQEDELRARALEEVNAAIAEAEAGLREGGCGQGLVHREREMTVALDAGGKKRNRRAA